MDANGEIDVSRLSDRDKQELQQFIVNETQKSKIQQCKSRAQQGPPLFAPHLILPRANRALAVHNLTDICWTKCITGTIKSKGLDKSEESCAKNCVDRFLDANFLVIKQLEGVRNGQ